jgi:peptide chain release factor subunit 1
MTTDGTARVLILTPVKNATRHLDRYLAGLDRLTFPREGLSIGLLESDSDDGTFQALEGCLPALGGRFARVGLWRKDFRFRMPQGAARWTPAFQIPRRTVLAKARNHLLFRALQDEDWVLWLDVDVVGYPPDLLQTLIGTGRDIVHPHCVRTPGGPTFDRNAWRDHGRIHMDALRGGADLVRLDSVGGTVLLVRADAHRDGLIFPPFPYGRENPAVRRPGPWGDRARGELETEGLGLMAADMGYQCWGMPNLEVIHAED